MPDLSSSSLRKKYKKYKKLIFSTTSTDLTVVFWSEFTALDHKSLIITGTGTGIDTGTL